MNDQSENPLNSEQQRIVDHLYGSILVVAPVGTGKTRVLAERVVNAVQHGVPADRVLCLTFTNRAAQEMCDRLAKYSYDAARQATIKTFHALCTHMLRIEAREIGLPADFVIYDDVDSLELVKEVFDIQKDKDAKDLLWRISDCKISAHDQQLSLSCPTDHIYRSLGSRLASLAGQYQDILRQRHALDFSDLIYFTRAMLVERPDIRARWEQRYDFIQVDEVQDTQISEYEIVRLLARRGRNLAMIGDVDQTIYGWRGSEPERVLGQFRADFDPVEYPLLYNYRATRTLLGATDSFADTFINRYTQIIPAPNCERGEPIKVHQARSCQSEARWVGEQIQTLANGNLHFAYNRVAVLTRTNRRSIVVSEILQEMGIPHLTVEQYEFFRRQEVKDALAYLRLLLNPHDTNAMQRVLLRPPRGIGEATISALTTEGETCGLRLTDLIEPRTFSSGDPFGDLLNRYQHGELVVFDLETTGLAVGKDEVVEIAAVLLSDGKPADKFHTYLRNSVPVSDSQRVHGYSDDFLAKNGKEPRQAFQEFLELTEGRLYVGHNVGYDVKMLTSHARRLGLDVAQLRWADTWNMANRFIPARSYRLGALVDMLGLPNRPSHQAMDDVLATADLLAALIPEITASTNQRRTLVNKYGKNFSPLAEQFTIWRQDMIRSRPAELLEQILDESGLGEFYEEDSKRHAHLDRLLRIFAEHDQPDLHPETSLRSLVEFTALAKNVDYLSANDNQIPVITIHQAKGLEFDTVFIAGVVEDEMPDYRNNADEGLLEEQHVFYVAMTRAKKRLFLSGHRYNDWGRDRDLSRFVSAIDRQYLVYQ
jgi:DNA helicase-2/ATP-dependent DNA helicase PcrA